MSTTESKTKVGCGKASQKRNRSRWHDRRITTSDSNAVPPRQDLPREGIDFAELEDGSLAEMIEDPVDPSKSQLAIYNNGTVRYAGEVRDRGRILAPLSRTDSVSKHIRFPQGLEPHAGLDELIKDVASFFSFCMDLPGHAWVLMMAFVFASYFPEKLPVAPYLALVGPPSSGKTTVLRILSLLVRRGLLTADISSAGFYDVSDRLHPTILIDETVTAADQRTLLHLLRSSSSRDFVALRKDKAQAAYGPKVLSWTELPNDPALNSRCIVIPMHRTSRTDLISPDSPRVLQIASDVHKRLLQFRLERYRNLRQPQVPAGLQLTGRPLDLYRSLALPFGEKPELCKWLAHFIQDQRKFQPALLSPIQASTLRVLFTAIHELPEEPAFTMRYLTRALNENLASLGEPARVSERKLGDVLTSLGFTNRCRVYPGNYVLFADRSNRARIHEKVARYEVDGVPLGPIQGCEICMEQEPGTRNTPELETLTLRQPQWEPKHERHERRERYSREAHAERGARDRRGEGRIDSVDRALDRALIQLERLERMRLGQPVSAPIKVSRSSSSWAGAKGTAKKGKTTKRSP